jgi:NADH-quinone oxidoreductase subunit N
MLCSATGMMLMASANDLITVLLALEILSIALYVLAAFDKRRLTSQEAGLKYFVLGSFSSAIFLYGIALTYGATGSTNLTEIAQFLAKTTLLHDGVLLVGMMFLLVGLGFKVAAAPFHMWTPDVYQGAPSPVTAFMAAATKAAAFAAILRVFVGALDTYSVDWRPAVWVLAALSLLVGSIAAVVQTDVKRMLAYQSISHAGYILIGVQVATTQGTSAALFYLCVYAVMVTGAFAVVTVVSRQGDDRHSLSDYRGLANDRPVLAATLTLFLFAQAGVPLTGGFIAKLSVFDAAVDEGQYWLALIGMLAAVIGAFVYLRIVLTMYAPGDDEEAPAGPRITVDRGTGVALVITSAAIIFLGVVPGIVLDFARDATQLLAR